MVEEKETPLRQGCGPLLWTVAEQPPRPRKESAVIVYHSLPGFKSFLGAACFSAAVGLHVLRFTLCFLFHHGRMSLTNAASFIRSQTRDVGNLARFLAGKAPTLEVLA